MDERFIMVIDKYIYNRCVSILDKSGFAYSARDIEALEFADFGLGRPLEEGAQIMTLENTDRLAVKIIILLPQQILPEHRHVNVGNVKAKQELLRIFWGLVDVYTQEENFETDLPVPECSRPYYTCKTKISLSQAEQLLIEPPDPHWFKAGDEGCVILSISTTAHDAKDIFTNPNIKR